MAKVAFSKVTPIKTIEPVIIKIGDIEITVIQYLPVDDKAQLISELLSYTIDSTGAYNPMRLEIWFKVLLIRYYTNINITDKQLENISKVFDALELNYVCDSVIKAIPTREYELLWDAAQKCANNIVSYNNSLAGMINMINADYAIAKDDIDKTIEKIEDPEKLTTVKEILDKIG